MKTMLCVLLCVIAVGLVPMMSEAQTQFAATLDRSQEVPATPVPMGTGTFSLNAEMTELTYEVMVTGVPTITASHFHGPAAAGTNAGVVHGIEGAVDANGVWVSSGVWSSADAQALMAGNIYVNIHTADYPGGEIRGQVIPGETGFTAVLDGSQEVPATPVPMGTGTFTLNAAQTELTYEVTVIGVPNITASHFHGLAARGENAGVVRGIEGTVNRTTGYVSV